MLYKKSTRIYVFGRRRFTSPQGLMVLGGFLVLIAVCLLLFYLVNAIFRPAQKIDLSHLRRNRSLHSYLDDILDPLVEPTSTHCQNVEELPVVALVSSSPLHHDARNAIRDTWGKEISTFFFLGVSGDDVDDQLVDNYVESKQYHDIIVFDFLDHYQNLTLKTSLMMHWSLKRCPHAEFVLKTDDDVVVNPWTLQHVLKERGDDKLVGFRHNNSPAIRDPYHKWYTPEWVYPDTTVPEFLSGPAYLVNGEYLKKIYDAAYRVPIINLEDVYFTYLIAKKTLNYHLTHDPRLNPYKPLFPLTCGLWPFATMHSFKPQQIRNAWTKIKSLGDGKNKKICSNIFDRYFKSILFKGYLMT